MRQCLPDAPGTPVNLEAYVLAKYVEKLVGVALSGVFTPIEEAIAETRAGR